MIGISGNGPIRSSPTPVGAWGVSNMVGWWRDEYSLSGSDVSSQTDLSGAGNPVIQANGTKRPERLVGGGVDGCDCVDYDGVDEHLRRSVAGGTIVAADTDLYMWWIGNCDVDGASQNLIGTLNDDGDSYGFNLRKQPDNTIQLIAYIAGTLRVAYSAAVGTSNMLVEAWIDSSNMQIAIAVNAGTPVTAATSGDGLNTNRINMITLGTYPSGSHSYLDGKITEAGLVKVYNTTGRNATRSYFDARYPSLP